MFFNKKSSLEGSHSLIALATYIAGQTPFPEFSVVLMLDDLQIGYYDSITWKPVFRTNRDSEYYDEEQSDADTVFNDMYKGMKSRDSDVKKHLNITDGIHVHQRLVGCELLNDDKPGPLHFWDAFDEQCMEEFTYDQEINDIQMKKPWMISRDQVKQRHIKFLYERVYHPICIKTLRRYLNMEKNNVMRKDERINLINFSIKREKSIINKYDPTVVLTENICASEYFMNHENHK
ncbi:uncharacterized protein LOC127517260 isoform X2 [Ctenopharyngodon idella]|uniref:uncharacterized protein LOC127517260 isoform X2 n=1 Tax=Ctenopharyngodon idella TaxID=7959 RepID=UPI00222EE38A|nr:uncharacterized protein LOC127517260 isoform X2 [Ctenopharyngodon idella]